MNQRSSLVILCAFILILPTVPARAESSLHFVTDSSGDLGVINPAALSIANGVEIDFVAGDPKKTYYGSAAHPVTGEIYTVMNGKQRLPILAKVDPSDGSFTTIGRVGQHNDPGPSASITFGPAPVDYPATEYPLYLITGNAADVSGAIYEIDATTGAATDTGWATTGVGAHALAYNPGDPGFLYHFYNTDEAGEGSAGIEKINLTNGVSTPITLTGSYPRANGVTFLTDRFYILDNDNEDLYSVTPEGVVDSSVWSVSGAFMNLSAFDGSLYALFRADTDLVEIDPATGANVSTQALGPAPDYLFLRGLARDPTTGILYGYGEADFPFAGGAAARFRIFQIDPLTGTISNSVPVEGTNFTSITFTPDGTLYGVTGFTGSEPGDLAEGRIATISTADGTVVDTGWEIDPGQNPYSMMIAFNSDDGLLYYVNGDSNTFSMRSINPTSGEIINVGSFGVPNFISPEGFVYDPEQGFFYVSDNYKLHSLTTGAVFTELGDVDSGPLSPNESLYLEFLPDLKVTDFSKAGSAANISFESVLNREYGIYSSTNLIDWSPVAGFERIEGSPPVNTETNVPLPSATEGFFRLGPPAGE